MKDERYKLSYEPKEDYPRPPFVAEFSVAKQQGMHVGVV